MATVTPTPVSSSLFASNTSGGSKSFLTATDQSPVQKMLAAQKIQESQKTDYFESEDFLRMKAFEIRARIVMFQNLGLTAQYQQAQAEGAEVVKKYQDLLAKQSAQALEDQVNEQLGLDTTA